MKSFVYIFALFTVFFSQQSFVFSNSDYNSNIKSPAKFLGYNIGDYYTQHHNIMAYMAYLAKQFPNETKFEKYGETNQKRDLNLLIISSKENMARLGEIQKQNIDLASGKNVSSDIPAIIWLGYNVHGNETSSSEAAMLAAYHFLAAKNAEHKETLENAVIIIDPMMNPDGRERYISWYKNRVGMAANADMNSVEHHEPWPGGRVNHYMFDLNRDWTWASQVETQARLKAYHKFKPHVFVDFHEMFVNSAYFFFPAATPINPHLPKSTVKWGKTFGEGNAKIMDEYKRLYYTAEWFDLFYPGYGDSYPSMNGSIGMTYEQAGHSRGGKKALRDDGSILTLEERAFNHYRTSVSTVRTALENRKALLSDFGKFYKTAKKNAAKQNFKYYIIDQRANYKSFVNILKQHDITVKYASSNQRVSVNGRSKYSLKKGQAVVPVEQAQYILLRNLMDKQISIPDTAFYDLSSWSLPLAFNLEVLKTNSTLKLSDAKAAEPEFADLAKSYAYIFTPSNLAGYRLFNALQDKGVKLRATSDVIENSGNKFPAGSILITATRNQHIEKLEKILSEEARKHKVQIFSTNTGLASRGTDLGSDKNAPLPESKILLVSGDPMNAYQTGAMWQLFDQILGDQVSIISLNRLKRANISDYTTLIIGDDWRGGNTIKSELGDAGIAKIKTWVQQGGHLIGVAGGANFLSKDISKLTSISAPKKDKEKKKPNKEKLHLKYKDRNDYYGKASFPGAFLGTKLDNSHPLTVGVKSPFYVLKTDRRILELNENAHNIVRFNTKSIYGYVPKDFDKKADDSALFQYLRSGSGNITIYNADPTYRMFTFGSTQLFLNAVYLGNAGF